MTRRRTASAAQVAGIGILGLVVVLAGCAPATTPSPSAGATAVASSQPASPAPSPATPAPPSQSPSPSSSLTPSPGQSPVAADPGGPAGRPTRVAVSYLRIDLPIVRPPANSTFPRCNVAEYFAPPVFQQPGDGGVTYIYAHARTGMFLPILEVSQRNGGKALIGREVSVWVNGSLRYAYRIVAVRRHQKSLTWAYALRPGSLVLQTSETPYRDGPKTMVIAVQAGDPVAVPYFQAHPVARPVACG